MLTKLGKIKKKHSSEFRFKVALEALKGAKPISELCQQFAIAPAQIYAWKKELEEHGPQIFADKRKKQKRDEIDVDQLHATIGRLKVENDFLVKVLNR
jgi:transposase